MSIQWLSLFITKVRFQTARSAHTNNNAQVTGVKTY